MENTESETREVLLNIAKQHYGEETNPIEEVEQTEEPVGILDEQPQEEIEEVQEEIDDDEEEEVPDASLIKVVINGEEQEVTIDDLKKGYMMQADYTKKTQEIAGLKRSFNDELNKFKELNERFAFEVEMSPEAQRFKQLNEGLNQYKYNDLNAEEKEIYHNLERERDILQRELSTKADKYKKNVEFHNQQRQKELAEVRAKEQAELEKVIPDLALPSKREEVKKDILMALEHFFGKEQASVIASKTISHKEIQLFLAAAKGLKYDSTDKPKPTVKRNKNIRNGSNIKASTEQGASKVLKQIKERGHKAEATRDEMREYFRNQFKN